MHPKEAHRQRTGTGRFTYLFLKDSELIVGDNFTHNIRLNTFLNEPVYFPVILYPGENFYYAQDPCFKADIGDKKLLVIMIDATWPSAKKMIRLSSNLKELPRLSFKNQYISRFIIKAQPRSYCLSTIESAYYLIEELKDSGFVDSNLNQDDLMHVFDRMVKYQIERFEERHKHQFVTKLKYKQLL